MQEFYAGAIPPRREQVRPGGAVLEISQGTGSIPSKRYSIYKDRILPKSGAGVTTLGAAVSRVIC
ncbi:MAG: hypothetical protein ACLP1Y_14645 [Candidatus Acidiferrales bacterium]